MFGQRVNFRNKRVTPFTQVLFGGLLATGGIGRVGAQNAFAMTAGGGLDIKVSRFLAIRPAQAKYFMTRFPDGLNDRKNNFRSGTGIVLRIARL